MEYEVLAFPDRIFEYKPTEKDRAKFREEELKRQEGPKRYIVQAFPESCFKNSSLEQKSFQQI